MASLQKNAAHASWRNFQTMWNLSCKSGVGSEWTREKCLAPTQFHYGIRETSGGTADWMLDGIGLRNAIWRSGAIL